MPPGADGMLCGMRLRDGQMPEDDGWSGPAEPSGPSGPTVPSGPSGPAEGPGGPAELQPGGPARQPGRPPEGPGRPGQRPGGAPVPAEPGPVEVRFTVSRVRPALALGGAVVFGLLAAVADDRVHVLVGVLLAAGLLGYGLRDLLAPVRLAAGARGVTVVTGYAAHRLLPWAAVERIRVDRRPRLGLRSELLEVDTGDDLYLFSATDLGVPCQEAADRLRGLRTGR